MTRFIGQYRIVEELGRGGMGVVYKAWDEELDRHVAVKVLGDSLLQDEEATRRFLREAKAVAALTHSNIIEIHGFGRTDDGRPYLVMEYVDGGSVEDRVREQGAVDEVRSARWMRHAASGLAAAHAADVLHRDVKPANLMLCSDERLKITDFGLALCTSDAQTRLTASGILMGTPGYLAPEQCADDQTIDARTDIYALGVTWYELLTGRLPFSAKSPVAVLLKIRDEDPEPLSALRPDGDPEIHRMVEKMMAKRPDDRYADASELVEDIENYLGFSARARRSAAEPHKKTAFVPPLPPVPPNPPTAGRTEQVPEPPTRPETAPPRSLKRAWMLAAAIILLLMTGLSSAIPGTPIYELLNPVVDPQPTPEPETLPVVEQPRGETEPPGGDPLIEPQTDGGERVRRDVEAPPGGTIGVERSEGGVATTQIAEVKTQREKRPVEDLIPEPIKDPPRSTPEPVTPPPPTPRPTGTAVVVVGDPGFAGELEQYLETALSRQGVELVDERAVPTAARILGDDPSVPPQAVSRALREDSGRVVLVRVEIVGSRELRFFGRADTEYQAQLRAVVLDTATGEQVGSLPLDRAAYTSLKAPREAEAVAGRMAAKIAAFLD